MLNTSGSGQGSFNPAQLEGTTVFDVHGDKVGNFVEQILDGNYLVVQKGWLFQHDLYIPVSAVTAQDEQGIYLSLSKDDLKDDHWKMMPTSYVDTTSGQQNPMPAATPPIYPEPSMGGMGTPMMPGPLSTPPTNAPVDDEEQQVADLH